MKQIECSSCDRQCVQCLQCVLKNEMYNKYVLAFTVEPTAAIFSYSIGVECLVA
jgi:hypothetical protein